MATASVTHTYISGTLAKASEVNTNFQDVVSFLQGETIHKDASVAFTAVPSGPSLDPTSDNHLVRKKYVDTGLQVWTPSWTNVILGTGASNIGRYWKNGREVNFIAKFILGTGGDVTSNIFLDWNGQLPAAHSDFNVVQSPSAVAWASDGNTRYVGAGIFSDGVLTRIGRFAGDGTNIAWDATQPFNWAGGALLLVQGKYLTA